MPAKMGKLSKGVGHRHPVTMSSSVMMQVCTLGYQTGTQYSALGYARAKAIVQRTAAFALILIQQATHEVSFPRSDSRCLWYVGNLSYFTLRYVAI